MTMRANERLSGESLARRRLRLPDIRWPRDIGERFGRWRSHGTRTIVLSLLTGVLTGLGVAGFELVTARLLLDHLLSDAPAWLQVVAPAIGLTAAALSLRYLASRASPSTADEYVRSYHARAGLSLRKIPGRIIAGVATLGLGGAMGFEGPSIYLGAGVGEAIGRRSKSPLARRESKALMVAGAAAGVSAIFKAPATGAIFALEVPYQEDLAAHAVIPALVASASSYVTFVAFYGTTPILHSDGQPVFGIRDLLGAAAIGILCGLGARAFAAFIRQMKALVARIAPVARVVFAGVVLGALVGVSGAVFGAPLTLGPGYDAVRWAQDPAHGVWLLVLLLLLRTVATGATVGGGGAGGLFIPLVVAGALLGTFSAEVVDTPERALFTAVGAAALLGAGYRTPIAGVVFVAESTGQPGLVVPGLIATALAQFLMGRTTIASYQEVSRRGHLEARLELPVNAVLRENDVTFEPDTSVSSTLTSGFFASRAPTIAVVQDGKYCGMVRIEDVAAVDVTKRGRTTVRDVMSTDYPIGNLDWTLRDALRAMHKAAIGRVPVTDARGSFLGVVTRDDLVQLSEVPLDDLDS
jgi:chloride channel protein, CIC family